MAGMVGMNVEEVRNLARQLDTAAQQFEQQARQLTSLLASTTWVGNDRSTFESDWQSNHLAAISNVVNAVKAASTKANQNAADQEQVSNA